MLARIGLTPNILVVRPSVPAKTLREFIALAKANPGKLEYGTTGVGTSPHLSFELFKSMTKTDITFIPYKTPALAHTDLLAGRISAQMTNLPNHVETVRAGKVRALGVTTARRSARMPDVPTIAESGLPGYEVSSWYGMCAPIGVDKAIQNKIEADTLKVLAMPESRHRLTDMGVDVERAELGRVHGVLPRRNGEVDQDGQGGGDCAAIAASCSYVVTGTRVAALSFSS